MWKSWPYPKPSPAAAPPTNRSSRKPAESQNLTKWPAPPASLGTRSSSLGMKSLEFPAWISTSRAMCRQSANVYVARGIFQALMSGIDSVNPAREPRYSDSKRPRSTGVIVYPVNACRGSGSILDLQQSSGWFGGAKPQLRRGQDKRKTGCGLRGSCAWDLKAGGAATEAQVAERQS